jgi:hypothetical protein
MSKTKNTRRNRTPYPGPGPRPIPLPEQYAALRNVERFLRIAQCRLRDALFRNPDDTMKRQDLK